MGEQAARGFRLGSVDEPAEPDHARFTGWLAIPYLSARGPVAIKFRRLDASEPKYDQPSQKAHIFNSRVLARGGRVIAICEGELDAVAAEEHLGVPAVATPGTTWLPHWPRVFGDFERVLIFADNDVKEKDRNPGLKHASKVQKDLPGSVLVTPPPGLDLTDWIAEAGASAVREACAL